ncbi:uncharacterized protein I206_106606 [Kwoniella pini CBS 10737]|uniref:Uncharacterized protein n=1 Tax=Kwoniella pini CBS 10737 TaxID=1296096 RepID=A0A1B9HTR3_9TREE|nr:uncharacterized protein I206_07503 [Kwoniella pini CBS 10737]OCF46650.1 hypothetical protein I206_07503 [Kwoniella pini CBS 10737]
MPTSPHDECETIDCTQIAKQVTTATSYAPRWERQGSILDLPFFSPSTTFQSQKQEQPTLLPTPAPSPPVYTVPPFPLSESDFALAEGIDDELLRRLEKEVKAKKRADHRAVKRQKREEGQIATLRRISENSEGLQVFLVDDDEVKDDLGVEITRKHPNVEGKHEHKCSSELSSEIKDMVNIMETQDTFHSLSESSLALQYEESQQSSQASDSLPHCSIQSQSSSEDSYLPTPSPSPTKVSYSSNFQGVMIPDTKFGFGVCL